MQSNLHKIKKGLDIHIPGTAEKVLSVMPEAGEYAVKPTDYIGVAPRLLVAEGDTVEAGSPLFEDKNNEGVPFVSPVSGIVKAVVRGEKRALLAVVVVSDGKRQAASGRPGTENDPDGIRETILKTGLWNLLRQRPFGIVPRKDSRPKALFVTLFDSSPLPVDMDFILQGREDDFRYGLEMLAKIAGPVHLAFNGNSQRESKLKSDNPKISNHFFAGPHPAGLVGTHISLISPINKGETVWTVNAQDVATIGHYFATGEYYPLRTVALCGPCVYNPQYYQVLDGANIGEITGGLLLPENSETGHLRIICGDVLSGTSVDDDGYLSAGCDKISVIPEGDYYDFMGWLRPNFKKFSFSRTFLSGHLSKLLCHRSPATGRQSLITNHDSLFTIDTGIHGSVRPLFVTGEFEKLVPLDIYPMQLIKACIVGDVEQMEELGIYEVEPEDLALCEFADTSKTEIQTIVRNALEKLRKECI